MNTQIEDGTGNSYKVAVTPTNRVKTLSVTNTIDAAESFDGRSYNFNTGTVNLTSGNESAVAYMKNNGETDIVITTLVYLLGNSTDGSGDWNIDVIRNPTAGTIVSGGTTVVPGNRNFGSNRSAEVTALRGSEGATITDGTSIFDSIFSSSGRQVIGVGSVVLPKGASIGVNVTPPSGNTGVNIQIAMAFHEKNIGV